MKELKMVASSDAAASSPLRTVDVSRASGYSLQQVRDLERLGMIPAAARGANGYRAYTSVHVQALRAYRGLATAVGPVTARAVLVEVQAASMEQAAAAISALHVRLARQREELLRARLAVRAIDAEQAPPDPAPDVGLEPDPDVMTISELAGALGVRPSTLRFWEHEQLVAPERVTSLGARRYPLAAIRQARIVAALRAAGHGVPAVREIVRTLSGVGQRGEVDRILEHRLRDLAVRAVALLRAGADLAEVVDARSQEPAPGRG